MGTPEDRQNKTESIFRAKMAENISNLGREQTSRSMKPKEFQTGSTQIRLH